MNCYKMICCLSLLFLIYFFFSFAVLFFFLSIHIFLKFSYICNLYILFFFSAFSLFLIITSCKKNQKVIHNLLIDKKSVVILLLFFKFVSVLFLQFVFNAFIVKLLPHCLLIFFSIMHSLDIQI